MKPFASIAARFILALSFLSVNPAYPWGVVGHEAVAHIAEDNLSPAVRKKIHQILGPDVSLAEVATWADEIKRSRPNTSPWHFIDLDVRQKLTRADEPKFCPQGDCIVDQIEKEIAVLKNSKTDARKKREALKFLIHFMGDLHQPLHCANDDDKGGNGKFVRYVKPSGKSRKGTKTNLHSLWDHLINLHTKEDPRALATLLEKRITASEKKKWSNGSAADWAWESHQIARKKIYPDFKAGPTKGEAKFLSAGYYSGEMREVVDAQLRKAGVRLAYLLENIFAKK